MSPTEAIALAEAQEEARRRTLQVFRLRKQRKQLREDAKRLAAAGSHNAGCARWPSEGVPCDCGWSEALAAHKALVEQEWSPFGKPDA